MESFEIFAIGDKVEIPDGSIGYIIDDDDWDVFVRFIGGSKWFPNHVVEKTSSPYNDPDYYDDDLFSYSGLISYSVRHIDD